MAKSIEDYKRDYAEARARGDAAGMKAANDGANAIRASQGQAAQVASADIAKVSSSSSKKNTTSNTTSNKTTSTGGSSGYTQKYTGGNAALDEALKKQSEAYQKAREKALAGDLSAITAMRNANDAANQLRNQYGYAAEYANDDIESVKKQIDYYNKGGSTGGSFTFPTTATPPTTPATTPTITTPTVTPTTPSTTPSTGGTTTTTPSTTTNYLEELYAAQKRAALEKLNNAYKNSLSSIDRAGEGLGAQYQAARNRTAGASELAARNFQEYAAASGLNNGAGAQSELARNATLQSNLNDLNTQQASVLADLELQKAQAETDYNSAIAEAEAKNDYELASALYQEKVRQEEVAREQQMLEYQAQRDAIADQQKANSQMAEYGQAFLENGVMPSPEMLTAMGMSSDDAQRYIDRLSLLTSMKKASSSTTSKPTLTYSQVLKAIESGNLTPNVLSAYKYYMGTDYTGDTGTTGTPGATGTVTASSDQLRDNTGVSFTDLKRTIGQLVATGQAVKASNELSKYEDLLSNAQVNELKTLLRSYGLT